MIQYQSPTSSNRVPKGKGEKNGIDHGSWYLLLEKSELSFSFDLIFAIIEKLTGNQ